MVGWYKMANAQVRPFTGGRLYIIDDRHVDEADIDDPQIRRHQANCNRIRHFYSRYSDYEIDSVYLPAGASPQDYLAYMKEEVGTWTEGELIVIYFDGFAFNADKQYSWKLTGCSNGWLNAYDLFQAVNKGKANVLYLLDCWVQNRWKYKPRRPRKHKASTEVIYRGEPLPGPNGVPLEHEGEFTKALVRNLENFITGINDKFSGYHVLRSIPEIMAQDKSIKSNPQRVWFGKTKHKDTTPLDRMKLDPDQIRRYGSLEMRVQQIQGPGETKNNATTNEKIKNAEDALTARYLGLFEAGRSNTMPVQQEERGDRDDDLEDEAAAQDEGVDVEMEDADKDDEMEDRDLGSYDGEGMFVPEEGTHFL